MDVALRLLVAAILGGAIGLEREVHGHPAGMRTHLLVSLGSAAFTVLSMQSFPGSDPSRIAAQIVTGVGFLGAGSILKEGANIRGLTTAASLWAVAAVGLGAGAGAWLIATLTTVIVLVSLWPLQALTQRFVTRHHGTVSVSLVSRDAAGLAAVIDLLTAHDVAMDRLTARHRPGGAVDIDVVLRATDRASSLAVIKGLGALDGIQLVQTRSEPE